jgi:ribose 5-phosphate isomerase B
MTDISDDEIRQIVRRVLDRALGKTAPAAAPEGAPAQPGSPPGGPSQPRDSRVVAVGADHGGYELKEILKAELATKGFQVIDVGTHGKDAVDYPDFAHQVARLVSAGAAWRGVVVDGAGIGSCIAANKVPGVRAGLAYDYSSAVNSRAHNDANVLTLGAGLIGVNLAKQILQVWLSTEFGGERHARRVDKIAAIERQYMNPRTTHDA